MSFAPSTSTVCAGQKVGLIATVTAKSPSAAVPTGKVTFYSGSKKLGTANLVDGTATYTTSFKKGTYSLKATYPASADFGGSSGTSSIKALSTGSSTSIKEST